MYKKVCQDCDCEFEAKGEKTRFCPSCLKKRQSESATARNLCKIGGIRNAERQAEKKSIERAKPEKVSVCDKHCYGCAFLLGGQDRLLNCSYWEKMDRLRPCPAGKGCTAKMTIKQYVAYQKRQSKTARIKTVKCQICGKEFETTDSRRKNCSPECLQISRHRASQAQAERLKAARRGEETEPTVDKTESLRVADAS